MNAEPSRLIPRKLKEKLVLEFLIVEYRLDSL